MKKLFGFLGAVTLAASASGQVISCNGRSDNESYGNMTLAFKDNKWDIAEIGFPTKDNFIKAWKNQTGNEISEHKNVKSGYYFDNFQIIEMNQSVSVKVYLTDLNSKVLESTRLNIKITSPIDDSNEEFKNIWRDAFSELATSLEKETISFSSWNELKTIFINKISENWKTNLPDEPYSDFPSYFESYERGTFFTALEIKIGADDSVYNLKDSIKPVENENINIQKVDMWVSIPGIRVEIKYENTSKEN